MITDYLYTNIKWQFNQNPFADLQATATTQQQLYEQLERLANKYFPLTRRVNTLQTEFCLNKVALSSGNKKLSAAMRYFGENWADFVRIKEVFGKKYMKFPADTDRTRLEQVAEIIAKCTQFAVNADAMDEICLRAAEITEMTERERRYLHDAVRLYKIKFYCAAASAMAANKRYGSVALAKMYEPDLLKQAFYDNTMYCYAAYGSKQLCGVTDCLGESAVKFNGESAHISTKLYVYANGRNAFDTFCKSKFGNLTAQFCSSTPSVNVQMQYFADGSREIRKVILTNTANAARKFTVEAPVAYTDADTDVTYFKMGDAICLAPSGRSLYCAVAVVCNNAVLPCFGERSLGFNITLKSDKSFRFDVVTVYARDSSDLAEQIAKLNKMGETRCPYITDRACEQLHTERIPLSITARGCNVWQPQKVAATKLNFTYRLGNDDVATFADNAGNSCTLLDGFAFGTAGESVYSVQNGLVSKLNDGEFTFEADKLVYVKKNCKCAIYHDECKHYLLHYSKPCKTLFYFPFERRAKVQFCGNGKFVIDDGTRSYTIVCRGKIQSFTTNALECNADKLRYKLSQDAQSGTCLAICTETCAQTELVISSNRKTPAPAPIIRESLVSTYLNYINDKNVFCYNNYLKCPDSLSAAAICYTNPQFVQQLLEKDYKNNGTYRYYDASGRTKTCQDKLLFALAAVYYSNLVGKLPAEMILKANGILFDETFDGKDLCVKALALLRACNVEGFDKVRCLLEYNKLKKQISADSKLYACAQAIGAIAMIHPSKQRLKDLCNNHAIPKSWYYVSQLENLYGLKICAGRLNICPKVTENNVLEQFALNLNGKRIDTTFAKASVQSMTLNGIQCYQPFCPQNLKTDDNQLVVHY